GAEADLTGEIDGDVYPEAGLLGDRIDQTPERPRAGQGEVVALAEVGRGHELRVEALEAARQNRRVQAGAVDHGAREERHRLGAADLELDAVVGDPATLDRGMERQH